MDIEAIASYRKYGPIVCTEETDRPELISISVDRKPGYLALFNWLHQQNPQKIALLFSRNSPVSPTYRETLSAFEEVFTDQEYLTFGGLHRYQDAARVFEDLRDKTDIDCIISNSDDLAAGLLASYKKAGLEPPLMVSQTSQLSGQLLKIPSIDNHSYQLGRLAFETAISTEPHSHRLPSEFLLERN